MTPMLVNLDLSAPRRREVWRHCEICDDVAAMPPHVFICDACALVVFLDQPAGGDDRG
ncbi:hypothetical protein [Micromonospora sp. NBC_01813]|uniref:hypothetical protein n=1 Tax=Micromonospora sp. NBC_01813 TaxID=2975988 RepID=UPI002DD7F9F6|nr:hypothetical protein [Micromonospora sp. NBC_01813]WSA09011.1 hypothetical protein OG958_33465 [Micromonospora sp. NBC_01813]